MEESLLRDKGFCCFVDFKEAFDIIPHEHLLRHMEEPGNVIFHVRMGNEISRNTFPNIFVTLVLFFGVEVWRNKNPKYLQVKNQMPYTLLLPVKIRAMEKVVVHA